MFLIEKNMILNEEIEEEEEEEKQNIFLDEENMFVNDKAQ